ncbi:MAG: alpha/beta fold hydrolase [Desulfobulbaceae bacterium]|nr:alpha/beta fold hydrolase [Desulfobulbaceae bacterium]
MIILVILVIALILIGVFFLAITFGGPKQPPTMNSINEPFNSIDFSDMPEPVIHTARDGTTLAYRAYLAPDRTHQGSVILVHGSSASGASMHILAKEFAKSSFCAYALDIRGHGESSIKGKIDYIGQLEDDLEDFLRSIKPLQPTTLIGFSSGGGFALRFAASSRQRMFSNYVLLAPFMGQRAPTYRPNAGGWVNVGVMRSIAIAILNGFGINAFNDLPVIKFALNEEARTSLTPEYPFLLAQNFGPHRNYRSDVAAIEQPTQVIVGEKDEVFDAHQYLPVFDGAKMNIPVAVIPEIGHIDLTLDQAAIDIVIDKVKLFHN